jgi:hypothetical protein
LVSPSIATLGQSSLSVQTRQMPQIAIQGRALSTRVQHVVPTTTFITTHRGESQAVLL